jgi:hypothetical protein
MAEFAQMSALEVFIVGLVAIATIGTAWIYPRVIDGLWRSVKAPKTSLVLAPIGTLR